MRRIAVLPLLLTLAAPPVATFAASPPVPQAPVTITSCSGGIRSYELIEVASYDVTLRNTSPVGADEVRFSARYGRHDKRATFDVKTAFPPNVDVHQRVRRTVNGGLFAYISDENDCFVDYVHFIDGHSWTRPR
jgi:hypothetical protein